MMSDLEIVRKALRMEALNITVDLDRVADHIRDMEEQRSIEEELQRRDYENAHGEQMTRELED